MAKKKSNKKQPWSKSLASRQALYDGVNPAANFGVGSFLTQTAGYLGGFRTGRGMEEDEARWAAYLGLPYDKEYAPDTNIRFEQDKNYPDRQYQGLSKRAKNEIRKEVIPEAKRIKNKYNKEWIQVLDERGVFGNDSTIYHPRETYTGDLGKFGIREVGNSGIYEIGDKYDFPSWIPVPDRNEGTELMVRDTIWSDRANPKLYNKEMIRRKNNKYFIGGLVDKFGDWNKSATDDLMDSSLGKGLGKLGASSSGLGGIANTAATAIGGLLAGENETGVGNALQGIGSLASNIPGVGGLIGAGVNLVGGVVNAAFGSKLNKEEIAKVEGQINNLNSFTSNASDYDALASNYTNMPAMGYFSKDDIGSDGWFSNKAKNKWKELRKEKELAEQWVQNSLFNNAQNIATNKQQSLEANYTAFGGWLNTQGGDFTNGITFINNGKSHEENPLEGVPMGIDTQGIPNLVEEGEVIFNDYVFSDRLRVPKAIRQKYKLREVTFAEAAKELSKESEERPNDPISKRGLTEFMNVLTQSQEEVRMKKDNNKYAKGGKLRNIFAIGGDKDNWLYKPVTEGFVPSKEDILGEMEEIYPFLKSEELSIAPIVRGASGSTTNNNKKSNLSYLRKAPVFMSGLTAISDIFSKPDYSAADRVDEVQINPSFIRATPLGNYLSYTPLDREFYLNKLDANIAAGRRAVMNTSGGNRVAALAGILATDYNYGNQLGDLARKSEEYNQAQRERVAGFNRQTDMFNSEQSLKEQSFNASSRDAATKLSLAKAQDVARLRLAAKAAYDTRRSNNLNNFITNLGNLGQEEAYKEWLDNLADKGVLLMNTSGEYVGKKKCKGGKLNRRR